MKHIKAQPIFNSSNEMLAKLSKLFLLCFFISACSSNSPAPVINRQPANVTTKTPLQKANVAKRQAYQAGDWRPDSYVVKTGDTLFSIGLAFGYDYKEIASANRINPPYVIRVGQTLQLVSLKKAEAAGVELQTTLMARCDEVANMKRQVLELEVRVRHAETNLRSAEVQYAGTLADLAKRTATSDYLKERGAKSKRLSKKRTNELKIVRDNLTTVKTLMFVAPLMFFPFELVVVVPSHICRIGAAGRKKGSPKNKNREREDNTRTGRRAGQAAGGLQQGRRGVQRIKGRA
jgi:murein DD-endopeptidase MepM/ murein hydrolase activator NlpD